MIDGCENLVFICEKQIFQIENATFFCFAIGSDISDLYPKRRMFNAKMESYRSLLPDNGVGNWLKIHVPIEYEGKRDEVEVTLTVKDSKKQSYRAVF